MKLRRRRRPAEPSPVVSTPAPSREDGLEVVDVRTLNGPTPMSRGIARCPCCDGKGTHPIPLLEQFLWVLACGLGAFRDRPRTRPCGRCMGGGSLCASCLDAIDVCRCAGVEA